MGSKFFGASCPTFIIKMVNTRAKGNTVQRKAIATLVKDGWMVSKVEVGGKFVKEKDMFGLYDLCCVKGPHCIFVQVTTNRPHTHKNYLAFSKKHPIPGVGHMQMVWYDRKGWKIFGYVDGVKNVEDLRK